MGSVTNLALFPPGPHILLVSCEGMPEKSSIRERADFHSLLFDRLHRSDGIPSEEQLPAHAAIFGVWPARKHTTAAPKREVNP